MSSPASRTGRPSHYRSGRPASADTPVSYTAQDNQLQDQAMHTFSIVPAEAPARDMSPYSVLNPDVEKYLADEFDILQFGKTAGLTWMVAYLSLHHFSLNPTIALKRMGCENADEALRSAAYACGFSGGLTRYSIVPLGIIAPIPQLRKYADVYETHVGEGASSFLHLLPDTERFAEYNLYEPQKTAARDPMRPWPNRRYDVTRFEQIYAGSGYTYEMLADGHRDMALRPVYLNLSNKDILLAYAYKDLSRPQSLA